MRSGQIIGAALLVLALGAADGAEARGRGARVARIAAAGTVAVAATGSIAAGSRDEAESGLRGVRPPIVPTIVPVSAPAAAMGDSPVREVRAGQPWCAPHRRVGTGTGFCLIN